MRAIHTKEILCPHMIITTVMSTIMLSILSISVKWTPGLIDQSWLCQIILHGTDHWMCFTQCLRNILGLSFARKITPSVSSFYRSAQLSYISRCIWLWKHPHERWSSCDEVWYYATSYLAVPKKINYSNLIKYLNLHSSTSLKSVLY